MPKNVNKESEMTECTKILLFGILILPGKILSIGRAVHAILEFKIEDLVCENRLNKYFWKLMYL